MRRTLAQAAFLTGFALLFSSALPAQRVEKEGKAWLDTQTEPAGINVNGTWNAGTWGIITLNQAQGSRDVTGTGDDRDISGVVSGAKVYLLFSRNGHINYSAELAQDGPNVLAGQYADALSWKSGTRVMHLSRPDAQEHSSAEANVGQAHVVVYRTGRFMGKLIKPSVYCDDQEVAYMYNGRYFTVTVPAGKHSFSSSSQYKSVSLNAEPGATYYVRVAVTHDDQVRAWFGVEQVEKDEALNELRHLKPAEASHLTKPAMISTALPTN